MNDMSTKLVNVRIPEQLFTDASLIIKNQGYASIQELLKESLRTTITQKKQEAALAELRKIAGSQKPRKLLSKDEMDFCLFKKWGIVDKNEKFTKKRYLEARDKLRASPIK